MYVFSVLLRLTSTSVGAFVAAPVGGLLWGGGAFAFRICFQWIQAKRKGQRFDAFDRCSLTQQPPYTSGEGLFDEESEEPEEFVAPINVSPQPAKPF